MTWIAVSAKDPSFNGEVTYGVSPLPGMKRVQLYRRRGAEIVPVAGFRSEEEAVEAVRFCDWLEVLVNRATAREG